MSFNYKKIDKYFLTDKNQFSKKRTLKVKNLVIIITLFVLFIVILGSIFEKENISNIKRSDISYLNIKENQLEVKNLTYKKPEYDGIKIGSIKLDKTDKKSSFNKDMLIGTKVAAKILGKVIATSKDHTFVRAKVINYSNSNEYNYDFKLKPESLLLGRGRVDTATKRLNIKFNTLVIDGKRVSINANAFMEDGSFGVRGKYSSGELKKYGARFGSNFIGGVSEGLKKKSIRGGIIHEVASLKNAILSGLSLSFLDYAQDKANENQMVNASIEVKDRSLIFVYFYN